MANGNQPIDARQLGALQQSAFAVDPTLPGRTFDAGYRGAQALAQSQAGEKRAGELHEDERQTNAQMRRFDEARIKAGEITNDVSRAVANQDIGLAQAGTALLEDMMRKAKKEGNEPLLNALQKSVIKGFAGVDPTDATSAWFQSQQGRQEAPGIGRAAMRVGTGLDESANSAAANAVQVQQILSDEGVSVDRLAYDKETFVAAMGFNAYLNAGTAVKAAYEAAMGDNGRLDFEEVPKFVTSIASVPNARWNAASAWLTAQSHWLGAISAQKASQMGITKDELDFLNKQTKELGNFMKVISEGVKENVSPDTLEKYMEMFKFLRSQVVAGYSRINVNYVPIPDFDGDEAQWRSWLEGQLTTGSDGFFQTPPPPGTGPPTGSAAAAPGSEGPYGGGPTGNLLFRNTDNTANRDAVIPEGLDIEAAKGATATFAEPPRQAPRLTSEFKKADAAVLAAEEADRLQEGVIQGSNLFNLETDPIKRASYLKQYPGLKEYYLENWGKVGAAAVQEAEEADRKRGEELRLKQESRAIGKHG